MSHGQDWREGRQPPRPQPVSCALPMPASQTPRLLPTRRSAGTGETAEPQVILAVWSEEFLVHNRPWSSEELGTQGLPPRDWGAGACTRPAPPPPASTSTPHRESGAHPVPSLAVLRQPPPQLHVPSTRNRLATETLPHQVHALHSDILGGQQGRDHNFTDEETDKLSKNKCLAGATAHAAARAGLEAHPG